MIKNLIFDLGNVLISFKPAEYLTRRKYPEDKKATILAEIFRSREWLMLDNGDISTPEAIEGIAARSSLRKDEIIEIFDRRREILLPITTNLKVVHELKKQGFRLYYLSNFPADLFKEIRTVDGNDYSFFKYFDGGLISAEAKLSKPDIRIYRMLLEKYSLLPEECLYIDDLEDNVKSAEAAGMKGIVTFGSEEIEEEIYMAIR